MIIAWLIIAQHDIIETMMQNKYRPRVLSADGIHKPDNFFYRLFSSQRFLAIVGLIFLLVILFPLAKTYSQKRLIEKEIEDVKLEINEYEQKNKELEELIVYLQSNQSLEEQARLSLNLKKPGEQVIVIEDKKVDSNPVQTASSQNNINNLSKWWNYFFK